MGLCGKGVVVQFGKDKPKNREPEKVIKKLHKKIDNKELKKECED